MNNKIKTIVICGPTGVGKTGLGISLAKTYNGAIVSADSRQIYKGLDISTGKDLQEGERREPLPWKEPGVTYYWQLEGVPIYLTDVVDPEEEFSVAQYKEMGDKALSYLSENKILPIIVGGTGLYTKALTDSIDTIGIPPNPSLRKAYEQKTATELLTILSHLDLELANTLNKSERNNKQRLLRRIEILQSGQKPRETKSRLSPLKIGLTAPSDILRSRIHKRIEEWVTQGAEDEVRNLLARGLDWDDQSMSSIGYRQWKPYFEGKASREEVVNQWKTEEWQYAKRQITWFRKDPDINWFDTSQQDWFKEVEKLVSNWYHKPN